MTMKEKDSYQERVDARVEAFVKQRVQESLCYSIWDGFACTNGLHHEGLHYSPACGNWTIKNGVAEKFVSAEERCARMERDMDALRDAPTGQKHDQQKARWDLLPIGPIRDVVKVLTKGAEKYSPHNWSKVPDARNRYYSAAMRHLTAWFEGERNDPEWGLPHLAHATCCLIFLAWFDQQEKQ